MIQALVICAVLLVAGSMAAYTEEDDNNDIERCRSNECRTERGLCIVFDPQLAPHHLNEDLEIICPAALSGQPGPAAGQKQPPQKQPPQKETVSAGQPAQKEHAHEHAEEHYHEHDHESGEHEHEHEHDHEHIHEHDHDHEHEHDHDHEHEHDHDHEHLHEPEPDYDYDHIHHHH